MHDIIATILGVVGLLAISSVLLPVATRINFPFTVLLALVGVILGAVVVAFGDFDVWLVGDFMRSVSALEITSEAVFFLFLPTLVFEAALSINVRQLMDDIFPILLLAIVGLLISTSLVGGAMWWVSGVPLVACLLLGAIVSATDPVAVIALFKDMGAPHRLATLVEGESLFNDATAIVLFSILAAMLVSGQDPAIGAGTLDFLRVFIGGVVVGYVLAWLTCNLIGRLQDVPLVEATLTVCLAYFTFIVAEHYLHVSGVMAVVTAGLVLGSYGRTKIESWTHLQVIWEQLGFWANSLIFFLVGLLVPSLLLDVTGREFGWLCVLIVTAFGARAVILYGLLPLLSRFRLAEKVSTEFELVMLWGGLRGAVSLALALAVLEHPQLPDNIKSFVVVLVTGFVLFTLFVNAPTMRILMHLVGIDKLEPADLAIRNRVMASSLANIGDSVREFAQRCDLDPALAREVLGYYEQRSGVADASISEVGELNHEDWVRIGLVTLVHAERMTYLRQFTEHLLSGSVTRLLLLMCDEMYDGLKAGGSAAFGRTVAETLNFDWRFRTAIFLHRRLGLSGPLGDRLADRFEVLLSSELVLRQMPVDYHAWIEVLIGKSAAKDALKCFAERLAETDKALDALRLQYPEYAKELERRHLGRLALRLEQLEYQNMREEAMISHEVFNDLQMEFHSRVQEFDHRPSLDLGLEPVTLLRQVSYLAQLDEDRLTEIATLLTPQLALPGENLVRKGDAGDAMYFISTGAAEVDLHPEPVRLGSGDFFGELALLTDAPRNATVTALCYCNVLTLAARDFRNFLERNPALREAIHSIARDRIGKDIQFSPAGTA